MTPTELKSARHALGLSAEGMARLCRVASGRTVRRWEDGSQDIPGYVGLIVAAAIELPGFREFADSLMRRDDD